MDDYFFKLKFLLEVAIKYALSYKERAAVRRTMPTHVLFCMADHYEPGVGYVDSQTEIDRVDRLLDEYPRLADRHRDSTGSPPKMTWFFPPHYHRYYALKKLTSLCERGYGEIELHLHHGKIRPDTPDNLERTIEQCIKEYSEFGIFGTHGAIKKYGFIHGDWALDNSRHGKYCGVNNEIDILIKTNCYADFTFPSMNEANPAQVNSIYYAKAHWGKPKSYNKGLPVTRGRPNADGLMMIQGPLYPVLKYKNLLGLRICCSYIQPPLRLTDDHIKLWVDTGIHVLHQENIIFIKAHLHGAAADNNQLWEEMEFIFNGLESNYNDRRKYLLHYITAREMYNIIKAIEDGRDAENINGFLNYAVSAPVYNSSVNISEASDELKRLVYSTYR